MVLPPPGFGLRNTLDVAFAKLGLTLRVTAELEGIGAILVLVRAGLGPSILPASAVSSSSGLVLRPLGGQVPCRSVGAVWHAGRRHDTAIEQLVTAVEGAATSAQLVFRRGGAAR